MNFKHLHYFWVTAKAGGIMRAGEQLHTTPQTLSGQIKLLEDWLGRKLFQKSGRNLELTEDGRLALGYADQIFTLGAELENAVRHGVEPSADGADVMISTQRRGSVVVIKVTNTVPARPGVQGHGLALRNVRDRLALLHDLQGQFRSGLKDGIYQEDLVTPGILPARASSRSIQQPAALSAPRQLDSGSVV